MSRKGFDINEWLTPENKTRIRGWCLDGLIDKQIYKNMGSPALLSTSGKVRTVNSRTS